VIPVPWVRLDDTFTDDPVLDSAGPSAAWLHVAGLCYSNRHLADGFIPAGRVQRLTAIDDPEAAASQLVALGVWQLTAGGYRIVHHLDGQPAAQDVERARKLKTARQARWRNKRTGRYVDASTGLSTGVDASSNGSGDARPGPSRKDGPATAAGRGCIVEGCVDGWIGEDDQGRPVPCLSCRGKTTQKMADERKRLSA